MNAVVWTKCVESLRFVANKDLPTPKDGIFTNTQNQLRLSSQIRGQILQGSAYLCRVTQQHKSQREQMRLMSDVVIEARMALGPQSWGELQRHLPPGCELLAYLNSMAPYESFIVALLRRGTISGGISISDHELDGPIRSPNEDMSIINQDSAGMPRWIDRERYVVLEWNLPG